jgi:hypothetical protein
MIILFNVLFISKFLLIAQKAYLNLTVHIFNCCNLQTFSPNLRNPLVIVLRLKLYSLVKGRKVRNVQ